MAEGRRRPFDVLAAIATGFRSGRSFGTINTPMNSHFAQTFGSSVEADLGCYQYGRHLPKPCIHPLRTPSGVVLSGFEPSDHVWHRGLWFTIKFINGSNFWEENAPFGVQHAAEPRCHFAADGSLEIRHASEWVSDATGPVVSEFRRITAMPANPGDLGTRVLTWESVLTPLVSVTLDRTPFTTWGGYGGLSFRATRELHEVKFTIPDGSEVPQLLGVPQRYIAMHGRLDGGPNRSAAIACFDHPANPRYPVCWYAKSNNGFSFFNAAFLFHEPMTLAKGQSLSFKYQLALRDGPFDHADLERLAGAFEKTPAAKGGPEVDHV
jgi:Methane oxygenase PmoA